MFKIIFKISDVASKEAKRDFNIDAILKSNEKIFDNITEYNQYVEAIDRIFEKNQKINLDGNEYSINDLKTITTSDLSEIILEVTVLDNVSIIDWGRVNKQWGNGYKDNSNWYTLYDNQTNSPSYNINMVSNTNTNK